MSEKRELKAANLNRSDRIIKFLLGHDLINRNLLCSRVDFDNSTLHHLLNGTAKYVAIQPKYLDAFEEQLKGYGFEGMEEKIIDDAKSTIDNRMAKTTRI